MNAFAVVLLANFPTTFFWIRSPSCFELKRPPSATEEGKRVGRREVTAGEKEGTEYSFLIVNHSPPTLLGKGKA